MDSTIFFLLLLRSYGRNELLSSARVCFKSEVNIIRGVLNFLNTRLSRRWTSEEKLDRMLKMLLLNAIIALYCTNTETFLHQQPRSYVSRCRAAVMALPPTGEPHRIPIGFLFSHLNRITNDTRPGNSNNWCLSVVWLTSPDAQLRTRIRSRRLLYPR